jgi:hypothetical protein
VVRREWFARALMDVSRGCEALHGRKSIASEPAAATRRRKKKAMMLKAALVVPGGSAKALAAALVGCTGALAVADEAPAA